MWHHLGAPWDRRAWRATVGRRRHPPTGLTASSACPDTMALVAHEVGTREGWPALDAMVVATNGDPLAIMAIADGSMTATQGQLRRHRPARRGTGVAAPPAAASCPPPSATTPCW
ncbi:MAG: hypothetical protein R2838_10625 [Caldilineaceae bacterium]